MPNFQKQKALALALLLSASSNAALAESVESAESAEAVETTQPAPAGTSITIGAQAEIDVAAPSLTSALTPPPTPAPAEDVARAPVEAEPETSEETDVAAETEASVDVETSVEVEATPAPVVAEKLTGREIALKMDRAQHVKDVTRQSSMLIERRGQQLKRKMLMHAKRFGADERSLIRFEEPADVRDTQYLSWVYEDPTKNDDLWVYFPSENMVRRISGGGKKGAFMRSDFANEDIEARAVDDDTHVLLEESVLDGTPVYVIESTPISIKAKDSSYSKRKIWVNREIWLPLRIEFYDKRGKVLKTLLYGGIEEIDGVWTATKLIMETPRKKSRTLMQYHNVTYDSGLGDELFNQNSLKR